MSGNFEQAFTSTDGEAITYIQYLPPDNLNVIIPNQFLTSMKEEFLEPNEDDEYINAGDAQGMEVLESVINIGKKEKAKKDSLTKELIQISDGKPKGRKRIISDQTREIRKKRANTNQAYVNSKGVEVKPKEFDEGFQCGCAKKCTQNISRKIRKQIFSMFWGIGTYEGRCAFLNSCVNEVAKKRKYTKKAESRRKNTRKYYLKGIEVCKYAFVKTLQISNSRIDICLQKMESENFNDERGKKGHNRGFSEELKEGVILHIKNNFKSDSSLRGLWNVYQTTHPEQQVSESFYKKLFYENFNLRFKKISKDKANAGFQQIEKFTSAAYVESEEDSSD